MKYIDGAYLLLGVFQLLACLISEIETRRRDEFWYDKIHSSIFKSQKFGGWTRGAAMLILGQISEKLGSPGRIMSHRGRLL